MTPEMVVIGDCTLYRADCLDVLPLIGNVSTVITSPPYNLGGSPWPRLGNWKHGNSAGGRSKWRNGSDAGNGIQYGTHKDSMDWSDYVKWQNAVIEAMWRLLPDDGAIFYNHKPRVIGAKLWLPLELIPGDCNLRQIIIWARPGGMNFTEVAFVPTHEWIMVIAKDRFRLKTKAVSGLGDVWKMTPDRNDHPAPFPIELPKRVLEATNAGTVLDPFMGSGTTAAACIRAGRKFVGIEIDKRYFDKACKRVDQEYYRTSLLDSIEEKEPTDAREPTSQRTP